MLTVRKISTLYVEIPTSCLQQIFFPLIMNALLVCSAKKNKVKVDVTNSFYDAQLRALELAREKHG